MAFKLSGTDVTNVLVAGTQAQRVMLGTGSTAVEVWTAAKGPARYSPTVYLPYGPSLATNKGSVSATPTVASGTVTQANLTSSSVAEDYVAQYAGRHTFPYSSGWVQGCCVSWWVRANVSQGNGGKDMWHRSNASATTYELYASVDAADGLLYAGCQINGTWWQVKATSKNISDGNWHHCMVLLVRSSSTAATLYLYVDGASVGSGSKSGLTANAAFSSSQPFWIGGNRTSDSWQGQIDDFSVFDTVGSNVVNPSQLYQDGRQGIVPPYKSGTTTARTLAKDTETVIDSVTIPADAPARLNVTWDVGVPSRDSSASYLFEIWKNNDANSRVYAPRASGSWSYTLKSKADMGLDGPLDVAPGDVIKFVATFASNNTTNRQIGATQWSLAAP